MIPVPLAFPGNKERKPSTFQHQETPVHEYTPPSQCEACVPVVTSTDYCTHVAHESTCPNRKDPK